MIKLQPFPVQYYYLPVNNSKTVLLIDSWKDQEALDNHHESPMMKEIAALREKYDLHMSVTQYTEIKNDGDEKYSRK